jgi:hypothetical protein
MITNWLYGLKPKTFLRVCGFCVLSVLLFGCGSVPATSPVVVSGNGHCVPASDLPSHKTVQAVPEKETFMEDLYSLLGLERRYRARDVSDYNSLWDTCVGKAQQTPAH